MRRRRRRWRRYVQERGRRRRRRRRSAHKYGTVDNALRQMCTNKAPLHCYSGHQAEGKMVFGPAQLARAELFVGPGSHWDSQNTHAAPQNTVQRHKKTGARPMINTGGQLLVFRASVKTLERPIKYWRRAEGAVGTFYCNLDEAPVALVRRRGRPLRDADSVPQDEGAHGRARRHRRPAARRRPAPAGRGRPLVAPGGGATLLRARQHRAGRREARYGSRRPTARRRRSVGAPAAVAVQRPSRRAAPQVPAVHDVRAQQAAVRRRAVVPVERGADKAPALPRPVPPSDGRAEPVEDARA
eukprot:gene10765-biopygen3319